MRCPHRGDGCCRAQSTSMADTIRRLIQRSHPTCIPISNLVCENLLPSRRLALSPPPPPPSSGAKPCRHHHLPSASFLRSPFAVGPRTPTRLGVFRPAFRRFDARLPSARLRSPRQSVPAAAPAHPSASAAAVSPPPPARSRRSLVFNPNTTNPSPASTFLVCLCLDRPTVYRRDRPPSRIQPSLRRCAISAQRNTRRLEPRLPPLPTTSSVQLAASRLATPYLDDRFPARPSHLTLRQLHRCHRIPCSSPLARSWAARPARASPNFKRRRRRRRLQRLSGSDSSNLLRAKSKDSLAPKTARQRSFGTRQDRKARRREPARVAIALALAFGAQRARWHRRSQRGRQPRRAQISRRSQRRRRRLGCRHRRRCARLGHLATILSNPLAAGGFPAPSAKARNPQAPATRCALSTLTT